MQKLLFMLAAVASLMLMGCEIGVPKGITPVKNFDSQRYLGDWFEIARLEHSYEKGLNNITANYSLREDGGIRILNRGYDPEKKEWRTAEGKAYFVESPDIGYLKVSFFGPFGPDRKYLWFLSRTAHVDDAALKRFIKKADELGFDTTKLIYVDQGGVEAPKTQAMGAKD